MGPSGPSKNAMFIVTLDPNKFVEKNQEPLPVGNLQSFTPYVSLRKQSISVLIKDSHIYYDSTRSRTGVRPPYPPNTKAFLYYFTPPDKPRIAGELRFRVALNNDPVSFESGSDLLRTNGQTWSRPLCVLPKFYNLLYEKLREEHLIPDDLDKALSTIPIGPYNYSRRNTLYTLNDTFIVDFGGGCYPTTAGRFRFVVISEQGTEILPFNIFYDGRRCPTGSGEPTRVGVPYTGAYTN